MKSYARFVTRSARLGLCGDKLSKVVRLIRITHVPMNYLIEQGGASNLIFDNSARDGSITGSE